MHASSFPDPLLLLDCIAVRGAHVLQVSLAGLWLMPAIISLHLKFWRFLAIWAAYSCVTGYLISLCMRKKMHHATPRKVPSQHELTIAASGKGTSTGLQPGRATEVLVCQMAHVAQQRTRQAHNL